jgi:hypothetical protein
MYYEKLKEIYLVDQGSQDNFFVFTLKWYVLLVGPMLMIKSLYFEALKITFLAPILPLLLGQRVTNWWLLKFLMSVEDWKLIKQNLQTYHPSLE